MIDDSETLVFFSSICIYFGLNKKYFCVIVLKLHFGTCMIPESYESFSRILIIRNSHTNISSNIRTVVFCTGLVLPHCSDNNDLLFLLLLLYMFTCWHSLSIHQRVDLTHIWSGNSPQFSFFNNSPRIQMQMQIFHIVNSWTLFWSLNY